MILHAAAVPLQESAHRRSMQMTDGNETVANEYLYRSFGEQSVLSGSYDNPFTWVGRLGYYWEPPRGWGGKCCRMTSARIGFLCVVCGCWLLAQPAGAGNWYATAEASMKSEKAHLVESGGDFGRAVVKARREGSVTIGYIGGSITMGGGASDKERTSWRALTTQWFREQFPEARVGEVNAAVPGTGSDLGAFRCQRDLLSGGPDLVFVEFAVNDGALSEDRCLRGMEGIVRQIWRANPKADIAFVYTTSQHAAQAYGRGEVPPTVARHQRVADHYGIPKINVGRAFWERIQAGEATWEELLPDGAHPSDAGYAIYAEEVRRFLAERLTGEPAGPKSVLPEPLTKDPLEEVRLVDAWEIEAPGWTREEESLAGHYPHRLACNRPETTLTYRFTGSFIGLYWLVAPDSGDIEWSVDGSAPERTSSWDEWTRLWTRASYVVLRDDLQPGEHELRIRVLADKNPEATGTWIRIAALLAH